MPAETDDREELRRKFAQYAESRDRGLRDELVTAHMGLAEYLARRFTNRGEPLDDLMQVASLGLLKAVDRFDPDRGLEFSTYATPTIVGELKRHFRDKGWAVRVPRRVQELHLRLGAVVSTLSQELGRSPTIPEIAAAAKVSEEEVVEAIEAGHAYRFTSLDAPAGNEDDSALSSQLGVEDQGLIDSEHRVALSPLIARFPPRERMILHLRFFEGLTQSEIASRLGISQMHVSRLLARSLAQLREASTEEE
ncbi:MAG TPA: SigB/SigF/SigG family RNA polymerase sigma factor [Acidimicrobiales bacterium]|jgi:RNA polymerase sigma-B factor|nr:SigB/SigF/SigG family RNA polymerase sigma factor [Acidimicrobiales bacterium]